MRYELSVRLQGVGMNHHCVHVEGHVAPREAGKSVAVPVWNGRPAMACKRFERRLRTAVTRQ